MGLGMDFLLQQVKNHIQQHANDQQHTGFDPSAMLNGLDNIFNQHQNRMGSPPQGQPLPASRDRYGDPADAGGQRNVKPASADPYGDPADERH